MPSEDFDDLGEEARGEASGVARAAKERVNEGAAAVQDRMASGADKGMARAADGLGAAADRIRSRGADESGIRASVQGKTADAMDRTASYLKDHDSRGLADGLLRFARRHPLQAAAGGLVAGFLLARLTRGR